NEKQNHKNSIYKFTKNPLSVTHCQILNDHKGTVLCLELFLLNNTIHLISGGDDCSLIMYQYIKNDKFSNKKQVPENTQNEEIKKDDTSIEIKNETDSKIQDQTKKSELNDTPYNFKKITSSVLHKLDITAICMNLTPFFIITGSLDGSICLLNYKMNVLRRIKTEGGVKGLTFYSLSNDSPSDNLNTFTFQLNNKNDEKFLIFVKTDSHLQIFTFTFPNNILLTFNLFISPLQFESYFNKLRIIKDDHENILAVPGWINNKEDSVALFKISDILTEIQAVRENDNILRSKIIHLMGHPSTVECIAFYKNKIITGGQDGSLVVWGKDHNQSDEQTVNHTIDHNDINLSTKTDH
ncbi:Histone transcription regulator HIRA, WD repeat superfamily, partial [Pseudoloma neurophilia]